MIIDAPPMAIGMGVEAARLNGFKHGYEGIVTAGICSLTKGTPEHAAWHEGYEAGVSRQQYEAREEEFHPPGYRLMCCNGLVLGR